MKDDESLEEYLRKYVKRTGVFRIYSWNPETKKSHFNLEFVFRGKTFFFLKLWRIKGIFDDV